MRLTRCLLRHRSCLAADRMLGIHLRRRTTYLPYSKNINKTCHAKGESGVHVRAVRWSAVWYLVLSRGWDGGANAPPGKGAARKKIDNGRTRTCAGDPSRFRVYRLNRSATLSVFFLVCSRATFYRLTLCLVRAQIWRDVKERRI